MPHLTHSSTLSSKRGRKLLPSESCLQHSFFVVRAQLRSDRFIGRGTFTLIHIHSHSYIHTFIYTYTCTHTASHTYYTHSHALTHVYYSHIKHTQCTTLHSHPNLCTFQIHTFTTLMHINRHTPLIVIHMCYTHLYTFAHSYRNTLPHS